VLKGPGNPGQSNSLSAVMPEQTISVFVYNALPSARPQFEQQHFQNITRKEKNTWKARKRSSAIYLRMAETMHDLRLRFIPAGA
jgi:hypothetical protein